MIGPEILPRVFLVAPFVGSFHQFGFDLLSGIASVPHARFARSIAFGFPPAVRIDPPDAPSGVVGALLFNLFLFLEDPRFRHEKWSFLERPLAAGRFPGRRGCQW